MFLNIAFGARLVGLGPHAQSPSLRRRFASRLVSGGRLGGTAHSGFIRFGWSCLSSPESRAI